MKKRHRSLRLTNDLAMKRAFGNDNYPEHLLGLIRTITGREYQSVEIINPYNINVFKNELNLLEEQDIHKFFYYTINDIKLRTDTGEYYFIEMQRFYDPAERLRMWSYLNQIVQAQWELAQNARDFNRVIRPVHGIVIQDYIDPKQPDVAVKTYNAFEDYITNEADYPYGVASITYFSLRHTAGTTHDQRNLQRLFHNEPLIGKVDPYMNQVKQVSDYLLLSPSEKSDYDRLKEYEAQARRVRAYDREQTKRQAYQQAYQQAEQQANLRVEHERQAKERAIQLLEIEHHAKVKERLAKEQAQQEKEQAQQEKEQAQQENHQMIRQMHLAGMTLEQIQTISGYDRQRIEEMLGE